MEIINKQTKHSKIQTMLFHSSFLLSFSALIISALAINSPPSTPAKILSSSAKLNSLNIDGWKTFRFQDSSSDQKQVFEVESDESFQVILTDLYCPGDRFRVWINGEDKGISSMVPESVFKSDAMDVDQRTGHCKLSTSNPDVAYFEDSWSKMAIDLRAGKYVIEVKTEESPYGSGYAAIRMVPIFSKCCLSIDNMTIIDTPTKWNDAEFACKSFGLELAQLDSKKFLAAQTLNFGCGPHTNTFIGGSWRKMDKLGRASCPSLHSAKNRAMSHVGDDFCDEKLPVLCQGETKSCVSNYMRT